MSLIDYWLVEKIAIHVKKASEDIHPFGFYITQSSGSTPFGLFLGRSSGNITKWIW